MKKIFIKQTKYGFSYQPEGDSGYRYFPDKVTSRKNIEQYLRGVYDEIELQYVNRAGQPAKIYTIKSGERFAGSMFATVDYDKQFLLNADVPETEQLDWLKGFSSYTQDNEADKLESDKEKIKFYLNNLGADVKTQYQQFLDDKLTPEIIRGLCKKNALLYDPPLPAEVEFL